MILSVYLSKRLGSCEIIDTETRLVFECLSFLVPTGALHRHEVEMGIGQRRISETLNVYSEKNRLARDVRAQSGRAAV